MPKIASIGFLNDERLLPGVLSFTDSIISTMDFPQEKKWKYHMACEEIVSERIKNAYPGSGTIEVSIILSNTMLEISVHDMGTPYWKGEIEYDPENVEEHAPGLEDYIISKMTDRYGSEKLGRHGQRTFIQFALPEPLVLNHRVEKLQEPKDFDITIEEIGTDDQSILDAITCIYDEYKYSYGYERLYYPENFKELIVQGAFHSFLARNAHGEVAGHYGLALSDDYPNMPEWSTVVVRRPFRGRRIFDKMLTHSIEACKKLGMRAILMQPTAYHTATQKIALRQGFTATGMLFQYVNSETASEYNTDGRRLDLSIAAMLLDQEAERIVYLPDEHRAFIKGIYSRLGGHYQFLEPHQPDQETQLKHEINSLMKSGRIVVMQSGADFENVLKQVTNLLRRSKTEMVEMIISLCDPAAPYAYAVAKNNGYFFAGLLPGGENVDYLVMQNVFGCEIDSSVVTTLGEFTDLLDYLRETVDCIK